MVKINTYDGNELFCKYYEKWIEVYKKGAIRNSTMQKYKLTLKWLTKIAPNIKVKEINRISYQEILNTYAESHEKQSTMDFHHQLKAAILDAVDEGMIERDPTRKAIIKGKPPRDKKEKYLNQFELQKLIKDLDLTSQINNDWLIYLIAKTGLRFSEALALTPDDFDFVHQVLNVDKTWNYKEKSGFEPTKNKSSERKVQLDWQTVIQFSELIKNSEKDKPIFIKKNVYNSTINDILKRHCQNAEIPTITIHGLRHTHASIMLYAGVSIASVAHRLGHASMSTTQKTYLHIIQELENTDIDKIMRTLTSLNN
uniref:site-specific integrase n=1 Tax=Candidatus Onthocola sp. TaxID=3085646 RepID=UPI003FF01751